MTAAVAAKSRALEHVERDVRDRAELVDVIIHAPLWKPTARSYRRWLCDLYGFIAPLEAKLSLASDLELAQRLPLLKARSLANDLLDVGMTGSERALLVRPCAIPDLVDPVLALGWLMILERMTWKLALIRGRLERVSTLSSTLETASSFLCTHEIIIRERWLELGRLVESHVVGRDDLDRMTRSAYDCLDCLDTWMVK